MKYKVIGWGWYDDPEFENMSPTNAAWDAIVSDIRENGYLFTGNDHQYKQTCAPILSNGKMCIFSARSFGGVMAAAHGYTKEGDYAKFAFDTINEEYKKYPPERMYRYMADEAVRSVMRDLAEEYVVPEGMKYKLVDYVAELPDVDIFEYIDQGDTIIIGGERYFVISIARYERMSPEAFARLKADIARSSPAVRKKLEEEEEKGTDPEDMFADGGNDSAERYIAQRKRYASEPILELEVAPLI